MAKGPVLDVRADECRARLYRWGPKRFHLYLQKDDATKYTWKTKEIPLPYGLVKARAAAKAYCELWKIKEGGEG